MPLHKKLINLGFMFSEDLYFPGQNKQYEMFVTCFLTGQEFFIVVSDCDDYISIDIKSWNCNTYDKLDVIETPTKFLFFRTGIKEVIYKIKLCIGSLKYSTASGIIDRLPEYKKEVSFQEHFKK